MSDDKKNSNPIKAFFAWLFEACLTEVLVYIFGPIFFIVAVVSMLYAGSIPWLGYLTVVALLGILIVVLVFGFREVKKKEREDKEGNQDQDNNNV